MTCISCTASIDYVLVRELEHILAALSFISFCSFLCYSIGFFFFTLPIVHSFISCVFLLIFSYVKINLFLKIRRSGSEPKTRRTGEWWPLSQVAASSWRAPEAELDRYPQLMLLWEGVR